MNRRAVISLIGGAAAAWPLAARAQQPTLPVIGFLNSASPQAYARPLAAFHRGLKETGGYVDGRNVAVEYRWADGEYDRIPAMAADLVRRHVAVIAANGPAVLAAKAAAAAIPIVFTAGFDPIALGLIASLSRPGGNITGISILNAELGPKRLELLREMLPTARVVAVLVNPANPGTAASLRTLQEAAREIGVQIHVQNASTEGDIDLAFAGFIERMANSLPPEV